jgi:hypothetical protein
VKDEVVDEVGEKSLIDTQDDDVSWLCETLRSGILTKNLPHFRSYEYPHVWGMW